MATTTLDDAIKAVQEIVGNVEGIRSAPEYATDKIAPGISSVAYPIAGSFTNDPNGVLKGMHEIGIYVTCPRIDLAKTLKKLIPMGELVAAALEKEPRLRDTVSTYGAVNYTFAFALNVGTPAAPAYVAGWSFVITDVKIQDSTILA
jgi:hypothetical protein